MLASSQEFAFLLRHACFPKLCLFFSSWLSQLLHHICQWHLIELQSQCLANPYFVLCPPGSKLFASLWEVDAIVIMSLQLHSGSDYLFSIWSMQLLLPSQMPLSFWILHMNSGLSPSPFRPDLGYCTSTDLLNYLDVEKWLLDLILH